MPAVFRMDEECNVIKFDNCVEGSNSRRTTAGGIYTTRSGNTELFSVAIGRFDNE